jgi:glycosyltransferase involved in cell wall biosynthesis
MNHEKVLILLCTFNGQEYLAQFLDSIVALDHKNLRLLVIDDASTDKTVAILIRYQNILNMEIFQNTTNLGARRNFLKIMKLAEGANWYFFADQDDIWAKSKLSSLPSLDDFNPQVITGSYQLINKANSKIHSKLAIIYNNLITRNNVGLIRNLSPGCTIGFNDLFRKLITSIPEGKVIMHDSLVSQAGLLMSCRLPVKECLTYYRQHENNDIGIALNRRQQITKKFRSNYREEFMHASWVRQISAIEEHLSEHLPSPAFEEIKIVKNLGHPSLTNRLKAARVLSKEFCGIYEKIYFLFNVIFSKYELNS